MVGAIWAEAAGGVIGRGGTMPWRVPEDMAFFVKQTMGHPVIMGRRTWESIPEAYRPFRGRTNLVISRDVDYSAPGATTVTSLEAALSAAAAAEGSDLIWLVGGGQVYADGLASGVVDRVLVTRLDLEVPGDTCAPRLGAEWTRTWQDPEDEWYTSRTGVRYRFEEYRPAD
jgi:dihydrofolate reductase